MGTTRGRFLDRVTVFPIIVKDPVDLPHPGTQQIPLLFRPALRKNGMNVFRRCGCTSVNAYSPREMYLHVSLTLTCDRTSRCSFLKTISIFLVNGEKKWFSPCL